MVLRELLRRAGIGWYQNPQGLSLRSAMLPLRSAMVLLHKGSRYAPAALCYIHLDAARSETLLSLWCIVAAMVHWSCYGQALAFASF